MALYSAQVNERNADLLPETAMVDLRTTTSSPRASVEIDMCCYEKSDWRCAIVIACVALYFPTREMLLLLCLAPVSLGETVCESRLDPQHALCFQTFP